MGRRELKDEPGFVIVWEFRIKPGKRRAFERAYGPDGDWATFFRKGKGYLGTDLIRDLRRPSRYLTLDFWESHQDYCRFKKKNLDAYRTIDLRCESLTMTESEIGQFSPNC